jgi:pimeloyl-ACP methyl ester carboxylesterase
VLLVAGRNDAKFVTAAERMAGLLPHPTVAIVDGAGHTVHLERPDEFRDLLEEWLGV